MDFVSEVRKTTANMSVEEAQKMVDEIKSSITAREICEECACGTPCKNRVAHNAIDHILLIELKTVISKGGLK